MAIQSDFYSVDGKSKTYHSTKHIPTKQHMAVWVQLISNNTYVQLNINDYELINNSAVLNEVVDVKVYSRIEVRVADEPNELTSDPTDIGIVADIAPEIVTVAGISDEVVIVAGMEADVSDVTSEPLRSAVLDVTDEPLRQAILDAQDGEVFKITTYPPVTEGQTEVTIATYLAGASVYINGVLLKLGTDYTTLDKTLTLINPIESVNGDLDELAIINGNTQSAPPANVVAYVDFISELNTVDETTVTSVVVREEGRGGTFNYDAGQSAVNNGGTIFDGWVREYSGAVNIKWFINSSDSDDAIGIQKAIDFASISIGDSVMAAVFIPSGIYTCATPIIMKDKVSISGESVESTELQITHTAAAFDSEVGAYKKNIYIKDFKLTTSTSSRAFTIDGWIRNCGLENIFFDGFTYGAWIEDSWTLTFTNCYGINSVNSHIRLGPDTGEVVIIGGRYDVAGSYGINADIAGCSLILKGAAVQFGGAAGIFGRNMGQLSIIDCFLEGNCIGNAVSYHIDVTGNGASNSSFYMENTAINDLNDPNRQGLGAANIDNFQKVTYDERWTSNDNPVPIIGSGVISSKVDFNSADSRSPALQNIGGSSANHVILTQNARPVFIGGQEMEELSYAPTTRAALNVGEDATGVALGVYEGNGAIVAYGGGGNLVVGHSSASVVLNGAMNVNNGINFKYLATGSNATPDSTVTHIDVDCTAGGRVVNLTNISAVSGKILTIAKRDGGVNAIIITPKVGDTINGLTTINFTDPYKAVVLLGVFGGWNIVG